ncbi:zinc-dependent metalloprotease [Shewanella putrefaciens]|uniref:Zinc-dependent metalloprotease n=1 Tax=Shewanella putrefaciens TaxID=24 RepID=A0ABX8XAG2_SHEPU|nr:zinc-dependent metalloprotease [Shewanella putrefaciens]AVV85225.1 peptidase M10A and M12B matrixin and adamalysin [Shewanella putrefaciens]MCT8942856.1 zinc-dependent metalloprotease [Shewanella putrefaciens]QSE48898.1 zinc-dependent metalloprotease [Shewanella putrefaciens]QYX72305.1 zinc-dependent metalloprotease [Shewanella putrefaciens]GGN09253.1 periplasmic metalloprotease [Shewanella putrefaciens]
MKPYNLALALILLGLPVMSVAASEPSTKIIKQSQEAKGFLNLYYETSQGQLYLEVDRLNQPFLLVTSLPEGVGSNDIGLDRGQLGQSRMVQFERQGPYIILKQLNTQYRANTLDIAELRAVKEAFADSVLWQGKVIEGKPDFVAINNLVLNDLHGVSSVLQQTSQGDYQLDLSRSAILPAGVKSFERNADVDVQLTFHNAVAGKEVAKVTPDGTLMSVRMRYSFVELPDEGYQPRAYHPMSGYLSDEYQDYATDFDQPLVQRFMLRHRLQKLTPGPLPSKVVKPIVYYLDPGVPEPIRSALLDGARWWESAFTRAGFIDGFQVKLLPKDADPQDIRYNMIQWVHRATRGWSYGAALTDPRTGEIIKGQVTLGSLRVRQDYLIAKGLTAAWRDRVAAEQAATELSLARLRQLAAHEVGHTLGLDHNFAASTNQDASVMDYPHPKIQLKGNDIDISAPYTTGIGPWDYFAITYGYSDEGDAIAQKNLQTQLLAEVAKKGLRYIGESDSRQKDASQAYASLWDSGEDPIVQLVMLDKIRTKAIEGFSSAALHPSEPLGELADAFAPIYLLTRYQIDAVAKFIGGTDYNYQSIGEGSRWSYIAPQLQLTALDTLLKTLDATSLTVPPLLLDSLVPKAGNYRTTRESFDSGLGAISDPLAMAEGFSRHTVSLLLMPKRLNRVSQASMADNEQLSVASLLDKLFAATLYQENQLGLIEGVWMRVNAVVIDEVLATLHDPHTSPEVKAVMNDRAQFAIKQLKAKANRANMNRAAHYNWLQQGFNQGLTDAKAKLIVKPLILPPGAPI